MHSQIYGISTSRILEVTWYRLAKYTAAMPTEKQVLRNCFTDYGNHCHLTKVSATVRITVTSLSDKDYCRPTVWWIIGDGLWFTASVCWRRSCDFYTEMCSVLVVFNKKGKVINCCSDLT